MASDVFCSENQDDYVQIDCGIDQAGIVAVAFIDENTATPDRGNLEGKTWWTPKLNTSPPTIFIATKTRGEYPGGTPTEEDGFGKSSTQVTGANHTATIEFEGLDENYPFVEGANRRKWKMAFVTNGGKLLYIDYPVSVYGKQVIPKNINTLAFYQLELKWQGFSNPFVCNAPDDIFDE